MSFFSKDASKPFLSGIGIAAAIFAIALIGKPALAAAPTFTTASLEDNSATQVTIRINGTDFDKFVHADNATADATDLAKITYAASNPVSATVVGPTQINAVFSIAAIGTGKSGGDLTIAAGAVKDAAAAANAGTPDTIGTLSITDNAKPVLLSVVINKTATRNTALFTYSEPVTVANGASSATSGDVTAAGTVAGFGSFATVGNATVPTGLNTLSGNGTAAITLTMADQAGGYFENTSTTSPSGVFTPVASAAVVDTASANQVNVAGTPTTTVTSAWTLTQPTITSVTLDDANHNGRVEKATIVFSAAVRDANITIGDALLGGATHTGTFATGTANDDTTVFTLTSDTLAVNTSATAAQFTYSGATTKITSVFGALLNTATDGTIVGADIAETDGANPIIYSISPLKGNIGDAVTTPVVVDFSETMNPAACTFSSSPDPGDFGDITSAGNWSAGTSTLASSKVTLAHTTNYARATAVTIAVAGCQAAAGPAALAVNADTNVTGTWTFYTVGAGSSGGSGGGAPVVLTPVVAVTLPNGGNTLTGGNQVGISWTSGNGSFVKYRVSYSADNGSTWTVLSADVSSTSYTWTVPAVSASKALIKVEGLDSTGTVLASDVSDATFAVAGTIAEPAATVAPSGTPTTTPAPTVAPSTDPTVKGSYKAEDAKANNPSINDDKALPVAANAGCVAGSLIKASLPTVYYCGADGKRYVFVNDKAFFSWYSDFSGVKTISDSALASIMIGGNITYRPGTRMVKIVSDPRVYAVARGGVLRWVSSEAVATRLFGANWNKMIDDVADSFFVNYKIGDAISE